MATDLKRPDWAARMARRPGSTCEVEVARYVGPADQAVEWEGQVSRRRYQILDDHGGLVSLDVAQAVMVAEMIVDDTEPESALCHRCGARYPEPHQYPCVYPPATP